MPLMWVAVKRSDGSGNGENVYLDGNYAEAAGLIGSPFKTNTGQYTFETLNNDGEPDWRAVDTIDNDPNNAEGNPASVTLDRIAT